MQWLLHPLDPLLAFISVNQDWAAPIVFVIAFLESMAFVALLIPGTLMLIAIGGLMGASDIPFVPVWLALSAGAALGAWASYSIGYRIKDRARHIWPLSRHPEMLPRGERFFLRWGAMSVVLGRFVGPLRATVPLLSGIFEMRWWQFQAANWLIAPLWALMLLAPGGLLREWLW
jgi:membrane protein DedA with SNARE-associated domain